VGVWQETEAGNGVWPLLTQLCRNGHRWSVEIATRRVRNANCHSGRSDDTNCAPVCRSVEIATRVVRTTQTATLVVRNANRPHWSSSVGKLPSVASR
jgi:hypothetical protein